MQWPFDNAELRRGTGRSQSRGRPGQGGARTGQLTVKRDGQPLRKQLCMAGRYVTAEQPGADSHATRHCVSVSTGPGLPTPSCARGGWLAGA